LRGGADVAGLELLGKDGVVVGLIGHGRVGSGNPMHLRPGFKK
jgi:hypothetical protein